MFQVIEKSQEKIQSLNILNIISFAYEQDFLILICFSIFIAVFYCSIIIFLLTLLKSNSQITMGSHQGNRKIFSVMLLVLEVIVIVMYGLYLRPYIKGSTPLATDNANFYPMYQDINVMMLIGFGFMYAFGKTGSWSSVSYVFFINAIIIQLYFILQPFWLRVFNKNFLNQDIQASEKMFSMASYAVCSVLVSFGAVLGRVGPLELLIMGVIHVISYTLNQQIVLQSLLMYDAGGSATIHVFGAYFGIVTSYILGKAVQPKSKPEASINSNLFALIGTLFFWIFWPSFNAAVYTDSISPNNTDRINVITNTIVALTGSLLGSYIFTGFFREKFSMEDILRSTLAGGVIIAAPCRVIINPAASLVIGLLAGVISCFLSKYLNKTLQEKGFYDTCGVHSLHGIIGILGGILSAICVSYYQKYPLDDATAISSYPWYTLRLNRSFYGQGGIQIAGTFISLGIAIVAGIVAGILCRLVYVYQPNEFYRDDIYFQVQSSEGTGANHTKVNPFQGSMNKIA